MNKKESHYEVKPLIAKTTPKCFKQQLKEDESEKARTPPPDEFLERFRERGSEFLDNAYRSTHDLVRSANTESLSTTLPGDVFSLVNVQVGVVHEYLQLIQNTNTEEGTKLVIGCMLCIICSLRGLQAKYRDYFLDDMESSCAAANDFMRMIECFDEIMDDIRKRYPRLKQMEARNDEGVELMEKHSADLIAMYGNDAVFAVERAQIFVIKSIHSSTIRDDLFSLDWEKCFVYNEVALSIVKTMEDFLRDFRDYLSSDFLYCKVVTTLIQAVICFYIRCLVQKADNIRRRKRKAVGFQNPRQAVMRMMYDIEVFETHFSSLVNEIPALSQVVERELSALVIIYECLNVIIDDRSSISALEDLILVLHKRTGANASVTRCLIQDLWLLGSSQRNHKPLNETIIFMQNELQLLSEKIKEGELLSVPKQKKESLPCLQLRDVLVELYDIRITQERTIQCGPCVRMLRNNPKLKVKPKFEPVSPAKLSSLKCELRGEEDVINSPRSVVMNSGSKI